MQAIIYLRVSTDEQAKSGAGLAAQLDSCRRWATAAGADAIGPFSDEGISGAAGLDKRPSLLAAIASLRKGDVLLVAKRDRLGRDSLVIAMIEAGVNRKGARIVSAAGEGTEGDEPTDVLMRRIVDGFSEYERLIIKARTKAALQAKSKRGERVGRIPYGFTLADDGVQLIENPSEQKVLQLVAELRAAGYSLRAIAAELTARKIPTKGRKQGWCQSTLQRIVARAA